MPHNQFYLQKIATQSILLTTKCTQSILLTKNCHTTFIFIFLPPTQHQILNIEHFCVPAEVCRHFKARMCILVELMSTKAGKISSPVVSLLNKDLQVNFVHRGELCPQG
jgi:hypothetical protein